jgi:hypothetical protein
LIAARSLAAGLVGVGLLPDPEEPPLEPLPLDPPLGVVPDPEDPVPLPELDPPPELEPLPLPVADPPEGCEGFGAE